MKIGFLHSVKLHLGNIANAKMYRIGYDEWKINRIHWYTFFYGEKTDRKELRGLIYNYRPYYKEFEDMLDYDTIFLSLNFDVYHSDFHKFVTDVINYLYNARYLHSQQVIIGAGNEVFEKRGSAEKVIQTTRDVKQGVKNSVKPNLPVCCWNQKVKTTDEMKAFVDVINNSVIKSTCKYVGYQSLNTSPNTLNEVISLIKEENYEPVDVELGTVTSDFSTIKELFNIDRANQVKTVFILTPYVTRQLANYSKVWGNYALQIGEKQKDKYKIINYVQQFKTFTENEQEVFNKMWDDLIFGVIYKYGTRGIGVKRIQKIFNLWIEINNEKIDEDGLFGSQTKEAIKYYQQVNDLQIDGIVGRETLTSMMNFILDRYKKV